VNGSTHTVAWDVYESPLGPLTVQADSRGLTGLFFRGPAGPRGRTSHGAAVLAAALAQLEEYFAGRRQAFDLPLAFGGTPFQRRVWQELQQIPYGATITYTQLADRVGCSEGARAVGAAVGQTPVPIIVPCHRVLAAGGALTGYRGGLQRKRALLDLERRGTGLGLPAPHPLDLANGVS
jgi:methylated-DNA-[protein]-cysteine S-methyltransferase